MTRRATVLVDADESTVASAKSTVGGLHPWVAFRRWNDGTQLYFSTLLAYEPALREIRWGRDDEPAARTVRFRPAESPGIDEDDGVYVTVPDATRHTTGHRPARLP